MNKYNGDYYVINLVRGEWSKGNREYFEIGVRGNGEIISTIYDGRPILQYNGRNAERFAEQMTTDSDPVWTRYDDSFPAGRS